MKEAMGEVSRILMLTLEEGEMMGGFVALNLKGKEKECKRHRYAGDCRKVYVG